MIQMSVLHLLYEYGVMCTDGRLYQARRCELKLKKFVTEFAFMANIVPAVKIALRVHGPPPTALSLVRLPCCSNYGYTKWKITLSVGLESFGEQLFTWCFKCCCKVYKCTQP